MNSPESLAAALRAEARKALASVLRKQAHAIKGRLRACRMDDSLEVPPRWLEGLAGDLKNAATELEAMSDNVPL